MTVEQISQTIVDCFTQGYEQKTNKHHISEALERLIPLLGYLPDLKRRVEYEYAVACSEGVGASTGAERVKLKLAEGYAATQKAELEEVKSLEKSLHGAISGLQSLLKEYD